MASFLNVQLNFYLPHLNLRKSYILKIRDFRT